MSAIWVLDTAPAQLLPPSISWDGKPAMRGRGKQEYLAPKRLSTVALSPQFLRALLSDVVRARKSPATFSREGSLFHRATPLPRGHWQQWWRMSIETITLCRLVLTDSLRLRACRASRGAITSSPTCS